MNRREFLKVSSGLSVAFFLSSSSIQAIFNLPIEASYRGKTYRGTADGKVTVSEDGGKSWRLHTNLGPEYSIKKIMLGLDGRIYLKVGYQHRSFQLKLAQNDQLWESMPSTTSLLLNLV